MEESSETEDLAQEFADEDPKILTDDVLQEIADHYGLSIEKVKTMSKEMSKIRAQKGEKDNGKPRSRKAYS